MEILQHEEVSYSYSVVTFKSICMLLLLIILFAQLLCCHGGCLRFLHTLSLSANQWKYSVYTPLIGHLSFHTSPLWIHTPCALNISPGVCVCDVYLNRLWPQTINGNDMECVVWLWKPHRRAFYIHTVSFIACQDDDESRRHSKHHSNLEVHRDNYKPHHMHHSFSSKWAMRKRKDTGCRLAGFWKNKYLKKQLPVKSCMWIWIE